jgi:uncharacterized protein (TIGR04255 family)
MDEYPRLRNPPITEALIDLRVDLPPTKQMADLEVREERVVGRYPNKAEIKFGNFQFQIGQTSPPEVTQGLVGYRYSSVDGKNVVQCQLNGFTFSRLKPYESWSALYAEAMDLWRVYRGRTEPVRITRVAVRYINHLVLPGVGELGEFLTAMPRTPRDSHSKLAAFLTRSVMTEENSGVLAIVTQNYEPNAEMMHEGRSVLLDIDAFVPNTNLEPDDDSRLEEILGGLRNEKNRIFFGSLTETARARFQ